ncbi:hypothetical protein [Hymenobacter rigui]|uniref:DUF3828 domain-containing protein n=1 Tax=Hymenobacter rigui TaxID=334424 RepID=A0A3R9MMD1_9BACT|nr:hypothetical protein [Hymenobacter rigui]RSK43795.1 hypothetical protein EI291_21440 [Hymenobacter rigui]
MKLCFYCSLLLLALYLTGCTQEKSTNTQPTAPALSDSTEATTKPTSVQHAAPAAEAVVRNMLRWYARNMGKLPVDFVLNADAADSTTFYAVNFPGTEAWLTALKASGYFSDTYRNSWRTYFRRQADTLRIHPQNDGPPAGFEYDFILYSQDSEATLQELQAGNSSSKLTDATHALVEITGHPHDADGGSRQEGLSFKVSQTKDGKWIIDDISNLIYSLERT